MIAKFFKGFAGKRVGLKVVEDAPVKRNVSRLRHHESGLDAGDVGVRSSV